MNKTKKRGAAVRVKGKTASNENQKWSVEKITDGEVGTVRISSKKASGSERSTVVRVAPKAFLYQHKIA